MSYMHAWAECKEANPESFLEDLMGLAREGNAVLRRAVGSGRAMTCAHCQQEVEFITSRWKVCPICDELVHTYEYDEHLLRESQEYINRGLRMRHLKISLARREDPAVVAAARGEGAVSVPAAGNTWVAPHHEDLPHRESDRYRIISLPAACTVHFE